MMDRDQRKLDAALGTTDHIFLLAAYEILRAS